MFTIAKEQSAPQGRAMSNRFQVKSFKSSEVMHKFLNRQHHNEWKIINANLKSGVYFQQYAGPGKMRWINVKEFL